MLVSASVCAGRSHLDKDTVEGEAALKVRGASGRWRLIPLYTLEK